jgi:hypothetical protein
MKEIDAHFDAYEHLKHLPREREALHMLRKAASMVKPIMRKRGWKIRTLGEFLPDEDRLLGKKHKLISSMQLTPKVSTSIAQRGSLSV